MVVQPPIVQEQDLLDPVSGREALPGVANYQRQYAFYGAHQYQANRDTPLMTQLEGADLKAELSIHKAPAEYCLPVKKDRRFSPVFQTKVCFTASAQRNLDFTVYAYPLSVPERQTLEAGASGEPPHLPDALREMLVHGTPPIFVDKHTYFRAPCHIAHSHVLLQPGQETKVVIPFEGLEFVKPSSMSPMTIAFAVCVGDTRDVALVLMTPATICVCRADQRGDAAVKLGYSKAVFERVNERSGSQKYKTQFNPPTRGRGGRGRGQGGAPAAAAAQPPPSPAPVLNGRPCAQDALAPPVAAAHTPAPLQPVHSVHSVHSAPLDPFLEPWHEVHRRATSTGEPPGAAQHGAATGHAWTGPSERRSSAAAAAEDTAALRWDLRRDDSLMHDLHALLEDADMPQLAAANAVSVFEGLECQITGFEDSMRSYVHMDAEAPGMSEGPVMDWDDAPLGSIGGHSGPARSMFHAAPAHQEAEGGYAAPDFSLGDLSTFPAEPMPAPEAPQPAPVHAARELPEHAVHELPEHAAAALPAPAPAATGGTAYGQQGLPHWMRPECRPVPTAVALGSRAAAAPPAAQPPPPPPPAAATVVPPMPDDVEAWLDVELQAPFSVFGEADDVGFGLIAQHSMQELDDGMRPLAEHRDRDGDNDTDAWMLAEIYAPPPEQQPPLLEPWPERGTQRGREAGVPVRRTRDRSPPQPGRRPPVRAPRFEVEALQQGVLEVETLLEPHEQPPARRATPFHAADGFNVEPYLCDGPGAAEEPSPAGEPSGWRADVPGPQEDAGGAKAAAEVGFGRVQAAALFDGMRPPSGARNLQDLLQLRCRNAAAPPQPEPEPLPLPRQPPPQPQWPPEPPSPKWAAEAPGADIEVPEPPGPGAFGLLEAHIEDPMEGPAFADDFMDLLGSDIDLGPDMDGGAFMVAPQAIA